MGRYSVATQSGIGEEDPDSIVALSHRYRPPVHTGEPTETHFNREAVSYSIN